MKLKVPIHCVSVASAAAQVADHMNMSQPLASVAEVDVASIAVNAGTISTLVDDED